MSVQQAKQWVIVCTVVTAVAFALTDTTSATPQESKPPQNVTPPVPPDKPSEAVYKNIQIFKGVPAPRLLGAMNFFARSLGVECAHCHVTNEFEKDDKLAKQTARKMYAMVQLAQKATANNSVSCYMCHRGHAQPQRPPKPDLPQDKMDAMVKEAEQDKRPAEQVYKNIQTLKGLPAGRLNLVMQMFTFALGTECTHCHVANEYEKDDKPAKQTARSMLKMVSSIAKEIYQGQTPVNCYTCHKGQVKPIGFPPRPGNQ